MKHTPGPWRIADEGSSEDGPLIIAPDDFAFVQVYGNNKKAKANARLIAAAPEMFEALKLLQKLMPQMMGNGNVARSFGIDFGLMNEALIAMDKSVWKAEGK
jgi:hypothetical protein